MTIFLVTQRDTEESLRATEDLNRNFLKLELYLNIIYRVVYFI
jgi:hypothetical protein